MTRTPRFRAAFFAVLVATAGVGTVTAHAATAATPAPASPAPERDAPQEGVLRGIWAMNSARPREFVLEQAGTDVPLQTTPSMAASLEKLDGHRVRVHGRTHGRRLQVSGTEATGAITASPSTTGPQKVAVILAAIGAVPEHPTPDEERAVIFTGPTSANAYYKEMSAGSCRSSARTVPTVTCTDGCRSRSRPRRAATAAPDCWPRRLVLRPRPWGTCRRITARRSS